MNVYYIYTVESHQQIIGMQNILLEVTCVNCTINWGNLINDNFKPIFKKCY